MKKRGQSWSFDIALAVVIFILTAITFFAFTNSDDESRLHRVQSESHYILENAKTENSPLHIIENQQVDEVKLGQIMASDYDGIKAQLGIQNDFCIYFEDDSGNVVPIGEEQGVGSSKISIGGAPCTEN